MSLPFEDPDLEALQEQILAASQEFDLMCNQRHESGAAKYGETGFLSNDTFQMAIEEVVDLANYARYTFIRLRLLQHKIEEAGDVPGNFTPVREKQ